MGFLIAELKQDVRFGLRLLIRNPTFTIVSVLTLALGIGATSAIFSVLDAVVLRPLPFRDPGRLVWVQEVNTRGATRPPGGDVLAAWLSAGQTVEAVDRVGGVTQYSLSGPSGARRVRFGNVGLTTLSLLGTEPMLGRSFQPDDPIVEGDTAQGIVISHGLWQSHFGSDPDVIGKPMPGWNAGWGRIVIGVMPAGFWIHPSMSQAEAWFAFDYQRMGARSSTVARLKPGVSVDQAQAELAAIAQRLNGDNTGPGAAESWRAQVVPLQDVFTAGYANTLYLLLGAVSFVLLIAAVNVANLQLSRGITRETEMSTRAALGAGRSRLLRQLVVENAILGLAGGVLGLLVASAGIRIFVTLVPQFYPPSDEIRLSVTVLLFALVIALLAGVLSGLVPALRASRPDLQESLRQGARGSVGGARQQIRRALVVVEMALALVLLAGAGLMINSYVRLMSVDMGLTADNVLTMEVSFVGQDRYRVRHDQGYFSATPLISTFYTDVLARVASLPGVRSVGLTSHLPPASGPSFPIRVVAGSGTGPVNSPTQYYETSPMFFETMEIPLLRGRAFTDLDGENAPGVAILNETLARQLFGGEDPIGQYVQVNLTGDNSDLEQDRVREVVGLVRDTRTRARSEPIPVTYVPYRQHLTDYAGNVPFFVHGHKDFVVQTAGEPMAVALAVQRAFAEVDSQIAVDGVMPVQQRLSSAAGNERFWLRLLGLLAGLAVFLAAIGIYGVISYAVEQRTREFGVRVVFGARHADILKLVAREGLLLTMAGLVIGVGAAFGLTRFIANQLYGVTAMDPVTIAAVAMVLVAVAFLASYLPSRRAVRVDPLAALRVE